MGGQIPGTTPRPCAGEQRRFGGSASEQNGSLARRASKGGLRPPRGLGGAQPPGSVGGAASAAGSGAPKRRRKLARQRAPPEWRRGACVPTRVPSGTCAGMLSPEHARAAEEAPGTRHASGALLCRPAYTPSFERTADGERSGAAGGGRRDFGPTRRRQTCAASLPPARASGTHSSGAAQRQSAPAQDAPGVRAQTPKRSRPVPSRAAGGSFFIRENFLPFQKAADPPAHDSPPWTWFPHSPGVRL
jgi:hypothetical protein